MGMKKSFVSLVSVFAAVAVMGQGCFLFPSPEPDREDRAPLDGPWEIEGEVEGEVETEAEVDGMMDAEVDAEAVGSWRMASMEDADGEERSTASDTYTLTLDSEGRLGANICNSMSGRYSVKDGTLQGVEVVSTLKFCEGLPGEVESAFVVDLAAGMSVDVNGNTMTLTGTTTGNVYSFVKM
jgi:heat shock protein HslJ